MSQTRHRKVLETIGVGVAAFALLAAPLVAAGSGAAAAAPEVVYDIDFDDESMGAWTTSGDVTPRYVDVDGSTALEIANRTQDFGGIESPSLTTVAGATYTFSMRAKLPAGTAGTADIRFVVKPEYTWIGPTTINAETWTTVTGTWTAADAAPRSVYLGTSHLSSTPAPAEGEPSEPYTYLVDDLLVTVVAPDAPPPPAADVDETFDFEDGTLQGWAPRATAEGPATVEVVDSGAHGGTRAVRVSDRVSQGQGLLYDVTDVLTAGQQYEYEAWVRFDDEPGDIVLSVHTVTDGASTYGNIATSAVTTDWTRVEGTFTMPSFGTSAEVYFETPYASGAAGDTSTFLLDDIRLASPELDVQDLTPLKDTVPFPVGVAIDDRETAGSPGELTTLHFDQITAENHMKPYAWYADDRSFRMNPVARTLMDTAVAEDLRVYGHVLVWHGQNPGQVDANDDGIPTTPGWMFYGDDGELLTSSTEDRATLSARMRTHIFSVAEALSDEYGLFGSDTNPLVAWDVVNEVIADGGENADGMRRSQWFNVLGEEFVDLAFRYADEAFNGEFAVPGDSRPVTLFINDYGTESPAKQDRYLALVERLLSRGVPVDGVGHQFHVSLTTPVAALQTALERFEAIDRDGDGAPDLLQAVTELDVATGTPVTEARLIDQGYYYRDAFDLFRAKADSLFSVTVWGLYDFRSWVRDNGAPLLFDDRLQAKAAYYGAAGLDLPGRIASAESFGGEVAVDDAAADAPEWAQLPLEPIGEDGVAGGLQTRWTPDALTVLAEVPAATDALRVTVGGTTYDVPREGEGDLPSVWAEHGDGLRVVLRAPLDGAEVGDVLAFNLGVVQGEDVTSWSGSAGSLSLIEPLSYVEVTYAGADLPDVDGAVDEVWTGVPSIVTGKQVSGTGTATAEVRTMWDTDTLYVLADVTDADVDSTATDPWEQDSVEIYLDLGNAKNGTYLPTDMQLRVGADNAVSFGTGPAEQADRVRTATSTTGTGYVVEVAIDMLGLGGDGTVHGADFQVNDATGGGRIGTTNWADPTSQGYQSTARWGVAKLVDGPVEPAQPSITLGDGQVRAGEDLQVTLAGFEPGAQVAIALGAGVTATGAVGGPGAAVAPEGTTLLGTVTVGAGGTAVTTVTVPAATAAGTYLVSGSVDGAVLADAVLTVLAAAPGAGSGTGAGAAAGTGTGTGVGAGGGLAVTGAGLGLAGLALLVILAGVALVVARHRGMTLEGVRQTLLRR
ncbi:endo-1,4-beta-xylanase [Cellulomonas wangsupingiae]|uniref:endo-1,4-beta-xylanase n=1 Tax=Cellulomonas wangsupingiae TaxID=2968085 RepID=UPI001D0E6057|nr:endo-1,4-beta-xylanase [Cellulomonas wangsupingiae]MCM0641217.1 endo-1,4-beta-xylanase [Cellulomonas wangsupingiae]